MVSYKRVPALLRKTGASTLVLTAPSLDQFMLNPGQH
ncbi:hypothetical protein DFAR_1410012 [Desulfarculales bacterium]